MKRNSIRIISNQETRTVFYHIKNEADQWVHVDRSSPLSRKEYTETSFRESAEKIMKTIDDIYDTGNRGVDLEIKCTNDEFTYLSELIVKNYDNINILDTLKEPTRQSEPTCSNEDIEKVNKNETEKDADILRKQNKMQVAFVGKSDSETRTLMKALAELNHVEFLESNKSDYTLYKNLEKGQLWYEVAGIDIGKTNVEKADTTIKRLIHEGLDVLIYCFSTNGVGDAEKKILCSIKNDFPNVRILAVLTSCVDEDPTVFTERMSNHLDGIKVLPVLAKDIKTRCGIIKAYGIEDISRFIYGGK